MFHSQLKIKYPTCPFLINDANINKTFINNSSNDKETNQFVFDEDALTFSDFLKNISDKLISSEKTNAIIDFLSWYEKKIDNNDNIDGIGVNIGVDVVWTRLKQSLKNLDIGGKGYLCINFHACAYNDEYGSFLNKEFDGDIGWIVIPIYPSETDTIIPNTNIDKSSSLIVQPFSRSINNPDIITNSNVEEITILNPTTYKTDIDNRYEKFEAEIRSSRVSARKFVLRDNNQIKVKHDTSSNTINTSDMMEYRSYVGKIPLTNMTRSNASVIRDRLDNPYKAYRFRNNPKLYEQQKKVDPHIREISDHVISTHNSNQRSLDTSINLNINTMHFNFDFILDKVGVKKLNGLYKFIPVSTGRISITNKHLLDSLLFVTVMRYKKKIHITLHELS